MKKSKKARTKQDGLNSKKNCKLLTFYIEDFAEYVNGSKNPDGVTTTRPLTEEEKDWLGLFSNNEYCSTFFRNEENLITDRLEQKKRDAYKYKIKMDAMNMYHRDGSPEIELESSSKYNPEDLIGMKLFIPIIIRKFANALANYHRLKVLKMKAVDKSYITFNFKNWGLGERVYEFDTRDDDKIKQEMIKLIHDLCMALEE